MIFVTIWCFNFPFLFTIVLHGKAMSIGMNGDTCHMSLQPYVRCVRGQAHPEYALTIVLVAISVIVIGTLLGLGIQRIYGVVVGALGTKHNAAGVIDIVAAECIAQQASHLTGLVVYGTTNEHVADLTGSTNLAVGTGIGGNAAPVTSNGGAPNSFLFNPLLAFNADLSVCPQSVVIQGKDGVIAVSPVTARTIP